MFHPVGEAKISKAIVADFSNMLQDYTTCDVIIVGGGPSGLTASIDLCKAGYKTLIIESNNYLGGGFWIGGYFMNTLTFRAPSQEMLEEFGINYKKVEEGLFTAGGPESCSKVIAAACDAGVKILSMTRFEDAVFRNKRVEGAVINWSPITSLPRQIACLDPISLESKIVLDATGHDASVCRSLEKRGILKMKDYGPMDVVGSEDAVVEKTGEIYPGLMASGMAVSTVYGIPRMGPTFGSMLVSGRKAANEIKKVLSKNKTEALV